MAVIRKSDSGKNNGLRQNSSLPKFDSSRDRRNLFANISLSKESVQLMRTERSHSVAQASSPSVSSRYGKVPKTSSSSGKASRNRQNSNSPSSRVRGNAKAIPVMPDSESLPVWLMRFFTIHRYSSVVGFGLVATTLIVYGWTVYSQQLWSQASRKLQNLQRDERQLIRANEMLKNKMAQEAEKPLSGLVLPTPDRAIFIEPSPDSPKTNVTTPSIDGQSSPSPVGY